MSIDVTGRTYKKRTITMQDTPVASASIAKAVFDFQMKTVAVVVQQKDRQGAVVNSKTIIIDDSNKSDPIYTTLLNKITGGVKLETIISNGISSIINTKSLL